MNIPQIHQIETSLSNDVAAGEVNTYPQESKEQVAAQYIFASLMTRCLFHTSNSRLRI